MPLRRCFSTLGCPELSLEAALALAEDHDLAAIEVRALGGTLDVTTWLATNYGTPEKLRTRLLDSPVAVVAFNSSLHLTGATRDERAQLADLAAWAHGCGVPWLRVFDGAASAETGFVEAHETIDWWNTLRCERRWQCDIMVETHDSLLKAETILRFKAAFPKTALLWDAHHTWRKGGENPVVTWKAIRSGVVHVHVKDSVDVPGPRHPFTYVLPGDGDFPMAPLLGALGRDKYEGPVSLEWEKLWHPNLPRIEEALTAAKASGWW
jgi:sugar phosphate isomerase/epimerase